MEFDNPNKIALADFVIDKEKFTITKNNIPIHLTKKELKILFLLMANPTEVQSRAAIFDAAWEEGVLVSSRTVDVHIRRLRSKIGSEYIQTVKGAGYQFRE